MEELTAEEMNQNPTESLKNAIPFLAQQRREEAELKEQVADLKERIAATDLGVKLKEAEEQLKEAKVKTERWDSLVRYLGVNATTLTGERKPHPAVTVKQYTEFEYCKATAHDWACSAMPWLLKLDERAFEKVCRSADIPFVEVKLVNRSTIKTDLSAYEPT